MRKMILWLSMDGAEPERIEISRPVSIGRDGILETDVLLDRRWPLLTAADGTDGNEGATAVLLVSDECDQTLLLNGSRVRPGMEILRHEDRLDLAGFTAWVSMESVVVEVLYDPEVHGKDVFCFRTKGRFEPGETMVICPGPPSRRCRARYKVSAWQIGVPCHDCRFDPSRAPWKPTVTPPRRSLRDLLELVQSSESGAGEEP